MQHGKRKISEAQTVIQYARITLQIFTYFTSSSTTTHCKVSALCDLLNVFITY